MKSLRLSSIARPRGFTGLVIILLAALAISVNAAGAEPAGKPNVLFIVVDDLAATLGCVGIFWIGVQPWGAIDISLSRAALTSLVCLGCMIAAWLVARRATAAT